MMQGFFVSTLSAILLAAAGCESGPSGVDRDVDAKSQSIRAAVHSNASVASKLAGALRDQPGNLFYSPLSIEAVTGLLFAASAGDTAKQIGTLLDVESDPGELHEGLGALLKDLSREQAQYSLSVANRLWAAPALEFKQTLIEAMRDHYDAASAQLDFASDPENARVTINDWVSDRTAGKIPELLRAGQISGDTELAVANAIYFKADWAKAFDPTLTRRDTFIRADDSETSVMMMTAPASKLHTSSDGDARWLELPYRTGDISLLAYTRELGASTQQLEADLDAVDLDAVVASLQETELVVQMPRFSMRSRLDLVPVFKQLGVTDLFDPRRADLSNAGATAGLYIDPMVHEAAVWIDESGTVATAATAAVGTRHGARAVRFDHPFLFFIRDNLTGAILFRGRVAEPTVDAAD